MDRLWRSPPPTWTFINFDEISSKMWAWPLDFFIIFFLMKFHQNSACEPSSFTILSRWNFIKIITHPKLYLDIQRYYSMKCRERDEARLRIASDHRGLAGKDLIWTKKTLFQEKPEGFFAIWAIRFEDLAASSCSREPLVGTLWHGHSGRWLCVAKPGLVLEWQWASHAVVGRGIRLSISDTHLIFYRVVWLVLGVP